MCGCLSQWRLYKGERSGSPLLDTITLEFTHRVDVSLAVDTLQRWKQAAHLEPVSSLCTDDSAPRDYARRVGHVYCHCDFHVLMGHCWSLEDRRAAAPGLRCAALCLISRNWDIDGRNYPFVVGLMQDISSLDKTIKFHLVYFFTFLHIISYISVWFADTSSLFNQRVPLAQFAPLRATTCPVEPCPERADTHPWATTPPSWSRRSVPHLQGNHLS
jgi:hypothetical protein